MDELVNETGLGRDEIPNSQATVDVEPLRRLLPVALEYAKVRMAALQKDFSDKMNDRANAELLRLDKLRAQHARQLELEFHADDGTLAPGLARQKEQRGRELDDLFNNYQSWIRDTLETDSRPHLSVAAVLTA